MATCTQVARPTVGLFSHGWDFKADWPVASFEAAILDAPVVPFRFGNVVSGGDDAVGSALLEARHDEFVQQLERVKSHVQVTVKVTYDEDAVLRENIDGEPEIARLRRESGRGDEVTTREARMRLGEMISNALEQRRQGGDARSRRSAPTSCSRSPTRSASGATTCCR